MITIIGVIIGLVILGVLFTLMYVKAPSNSAYLLSGFKKVPRVLVGTGGLKIPFLERLDKVYLGQINIDIKTSAPVPTHDFIDVNVDGVCKVAVINSLDGIRLAAKHILNMTGQQIASQVKENLEGNLRECVGALNLRELVTDRDQFSNKVQEMAEKDMNAMGLTILSCNIQNITDERELISGLGADNVYRIRQDAAITKANAEKEIAIAEQKAKKEANDVRIATETEIAIRNNELSIKKADLKRESDTKQAEADAAYEIQKQEQLKTVNTKTVDAQIEQTKREQILSNERIKIKQNELQAEVNAQADANKYQTQIDAEAALEQQKRNAEAEAYKAEQEAKAIRAKAEAKKFEMEQEAEGIRAKGIAEAEAIKAKGMAEAEAMDKKAEAMQKYGQAAIIDILAPILPEMAKAVAEPISTIDSVNIYGGDGSVSGISKNVPTVIKQTIDTLKSVTGVDLSEVAQKKLNNNSN